MRVVHWYPNFLHGGGCANAVLGLATAQARQGAEVTIAAAAPSSGPLYQPMDSTEVNILAWQPRRTLEIGGQHVRLSTRRQTAELTALAPDIVHAHGEFNLDNLRVSRLFRCPIVISPHGACHPVVLAKSRRVAKRTFLAVESLLLMNHVRAFHALSPAEAEHVASAVPGAAIYCVPQGPSVLVPGCLQLRRCVPDHGGKVHFLFLGRLDVFTKGLDILIEAFAAVAAMAGGKSSRLVLAGPDWKGGRSRLRELAARLGVESRVEFTGALTGEQVGLALSSADVYVQLSRHEGFPMSVTEALLASMPSVLSSAIGTVSHSEIASLAQVQVVMPDVDQAADAMLDVAKRLPAMTRAALRSREELADFFSWDRIARLHLSQYERLSAGRPAVAMSLVGG